jgi:hypothetical protein
MIAAFADFWVRADAPDSATAPKPPRRSEPLLMGDILTARGGEPDFLIRWRRDRAATDDE